MKLSKKEHRNLKWSFFASGEGFLKITHFTLFKFFGALSSFTWFLFLVTLVIGAVEALIQGARAYRSNISFVPEVRPVLGAVGFGVVAVYMTVIPLYVLSFEGADIALFGFLTTLSILPGALFDRLFGDRLRLKQWLGVALFVLGSYAFLGSPSLMELKELPTWMYWAFSFPIAAAINELLIRFVGVKELNPTVTTFWVGATQLAVCSVCLVVLFSVGLFNLSLLGGIQLHVWALIFLLALLIIASHIFKQLAYSPRAGGTIVAKKVVMIGILLIGTFIVDWVFYGTVLTLGKVIGTVGFLLATYLVVSRN